MIPPSVKEKVTIENAKSAAIDQATKAGQAIYGAAVAAAEAFIARVLAPFNAIISLVQKGISLAKSAVNRANDTSAGGKENILDPARDKLLTVAGTLAGQVIGQVTQAVDAVLQGALARAEALLGPYASVIRNVYDKLGKIIADGQKSGTSAVPMDNTSTIMQGAPLGNESIPTDNKGIMNSITVNRSTQLPGLDQQIESINGMSASTVGEKIFVRNYLKSLKSSSDMYGLALDNVYTKDVSDQICLLTLGHTIDTPALDPEDWFDNTTIGLDTGALQGMSTSPYKGPANLWPETCKYKVRTFVQEQMQAAYEKVNRQMYLNMYRDRYYTNDVSSVYDYPIARYPTDDAGTEIFAGLKVQTTSHTNAGDYASYSFAKIYNTKQDEISNIGIPAELMQLIGYLFPINNFESITEKPLYTIDINKTSIVIDTRGSRHLLAASKPDDSVVTA